jgi:hypothetical protein
MSAKRSTVCIRIQMNSAAFGAAFPRGIIAICVITVLFAHHFGVTSARASSIICDDPFASYLA